MSKYKVTAVYTLESDATEEELIEAFDQDAGDEVDCDLGDSQVTISYKIEEVDTTVEVLEF